MITRRSKSFSGKPDELIAHFGLDSRGIAAAALRLLKRL